MPDIWMDVDIAVQVPVNIMPLIDPTDFKTIEDNIAYDEAGMAVVWNFVTTDGFMTSTAVVPTTSGLHDWFEEGGNLGMYSLVIPASGGTVDNDTEGVGWIVGNTTNCLPFRGPTIGFRAAAINDAFIDSDTLIDNADNQLLKESVILTVTGQQELILTDAFAVDSSWVGCICSLDDVSTGELYSGNVWISAATQSTNTVELSSAFPVTVVTGDKLRIHTAQHPGYALQQYDAATGAEANTILSKLLKYFQLALRKDGAILTDNATEDTEINADGGSGGGSYVNTTDAQEAILDHQATIKTKTEQLSFDVTNRVQVDVTNVAGGADLQVSGTGGQEHGES